MPPLPRLLVTCFADIIPTRPAADSPAALIGSTPSSRIHHHESFTQPPRYPPTYLHYVQHTLRLCPSPAPLTGSSYTWTPTPEPCLIARPLPRLHLTPTAPPPPPSCPSAPQSSSQLTTRLSLASRALPMVAPLPASSQSDREGKTVTKSNLNFFSPAVWPSYT